MQNKEKENKCGKTIIKMRDVVGTDVDKTEDGEKIIIPDIEIVIESDNFIEAKDENN